MAEVASSAASVAHTDSNNPAAPAAAAGEAATAPSASTAPSTTVEEVKQTAPKTADNAVATALADDTANGEEETGENGVAAPNEEAPNGVADSAKKQAKRKSVTGVPEHKSKKLSRKKSVKALPTLHLDVEPGTYWYAHMKGHPPWPSIICDEDMLPETLLGRRPVSAANANGTYRPDYQDGGKNAKDRRYPIMFLHTNEFAWHVNTELQPIDIAEVKEMVEKDDKGKKSKALWEAYIVASEEHDLDHFKGLLRQHEQGLIEEQEAVRKAEEEKEKAKAEAEAKKAEKAAKKEKRKSEVKPKKAGEDEDMPDAEAGEASGKKGTKRKKPVESEGEGAKPVKTPKVLKVNGPKEDAEAKPKKAQKPKKSKVVEGETSATPQQPEEKFLTEEEKQEKLYKTVLYLRHKLQKGFLNRDQEPKADEMDLMNEQFKQLEAVEGINADIIKRTKINKVLKAIIRLTSIPKEEIHEFKRRSTDLLQDYNKLLAVDGGASEPPPSATEPPTTNGVGKADGSHSPAAKETKAEVEDVSMVDAPAQPKEQAKTESGAPSAAETTATEAPTVESAA